MVECVWAGFQAPSYPRSAVAGHQGVDIGLSVCGQRVRTGMPVPPYPWSAWAGHQGLSVCGRGSKPHLILGLLWQVIKVWT